MARGTDLRNKNQAMAATLAALGIKRDTIVCPMGHGKCPPFRRIDSLLDHLGNHRPVKR